MLKKTKRPRLADRVADREEEIDQLGPEETEEESNSLKRHRQLRNVAYRELISLVEFINGFTPLATQHSVKGAEFENVLVILSGGWNHYNWPKFLDLLQTGNVPAKDLAGFMRARNLFYVGSVPTEEAACCPCYPDAGPKRAFSSGGAFWGKAM